MENNKTKQSEVNTQNGQNNQKKRVRPILEGCLCCLVMLVLGALLLFIVVLVIAKICGKAEGVNTFFLIPPLLILVFIFYPIIEKVTKD